jgi:hypothetical protein
MLTTSPPSLSLALIATYSTCPDYLTVDGKHATEDEFVANFSMAQKQLQKSVPAALDFILGKRLAEL